MKDRRRAKAVEYLGGACAKCGVTEDLQFDHRDPTTKVIAISDAIGRCWSWERLEVELKKCQLLCRDHHQEKTVVETQPRQFDHGTSAMYRREKCRCPECRAWKARTR